MRLTLVHYCKDSWHNINIFVALYEPWKPETKPSPFEAESIIQPSLVQIMACRLVVNWTRRNKLGEILIEIHIFIFKIVHLKMSTAKWRPFCFGLSVLLCVLFPFDTPITFMSFMLPCNLVRVLYIKWHQCYTILISMTQLYLYYKYFWVTHR